MLVSFSFTPLSNFFRTLQYINLSEILCNELFRLLLCSSKTCCIVQENITLLLTLRQTILKFIKCNSIFVRESESICVLLGCLSQSISTQGGINVISLLSKIIFKKRMFWCIKLSLFTLRQCWIFFSLSLNRNVQRQF